MPNFITMLKLSRHEEGGYFAVFYKSSDKVIPFNKRYHLRLFKNQIERNAGSSIYYLLENDNFSAWHRLKSDEIWHFYAGTGPIKIHVIGNDGQLKTHVLGNPSLIEHASFQVVVKAGEWFAAELHNKFSFALVGCTVSPAFEYDDFELAESNKEQLLNQFPELTNVINKFLKPNNIQLGNKAQDHIISQAKNRFSAQDYIQKFKLEKHQEGGYFAVNFQSTDVVIPLDNRYSNQLINRNDDDKNTPYYAGSAIYYLLENDDFSAWHQLKSDEIWHYYDGMSPIDIYLIDKNGQMQISTLGNPLVTDNAAFQVIIKAGEWFAAELRDKTSFGLVGCTVSPAFKYDDFILGNREHLISCYPAYEPIINRLTRTTPMVY